MLQGKAAVVTGSTSGIGYGIAAALAEQGANIMLNGFGDAQAVEALRAGLEQQFGIKAAFNGGDLSRPEACEALIAEARAAFGAVDILVNNVGIQHVAPTQDFPAERWDAIMAINLSSYFHTTRAALPDMQQRGWGRIVNTASVHGLVASTGKAAYVAAKHGVVGLTKVVALENAENGVTCNAICPGWVDTPLVQAQIEARAQATGGSLEDGKRALLGEKQPSRRFATPADIGALVTFLCSPAAHNMTGTALPVDGGWTAQ